MQVFLFAGGYQYDLLPAQEQFFLLSLRDFS
jgi:hypothetical protein